MLAGRYITAFEQVASFKLKLNIKKRLLSYRA
jgi:hypothetical protein